MNKLYLTVALMGVFAVTSVHAGDYLAAGVKSEVPEYDTVDKTQLQNKVGIEAGLSTGEVITQDNQQRQNGTASHSSTLTVVAPQNSVAVSSDAMVTNENVLVVPQPQPQATMPAASGEVVVDSTVVVPQTVTVEEFAVGNTDTGVDMNQVQELLQK